MTDPVCGMTVEVETAAAAWEHDGTVYYFCTFHPTLMAGEVVVVR